MNSLLYAAVFGLAGGIAGLLIHFGIELREPRRSLKERCLTVLASMVVVSGLWIKHHAADRVFGVYVVLALVLIGTSVVDLRKQVISHWITIPGIAAGLAVSTWVLPTGFRNAVAGMLVGGGILLFTTLVEALRGREVGGGDWKLAAAIGSFLGAWPTVVAMFVAGLCGLSVGVALLLRGVPSKPAALGPYIGAGGIAAMLLN